jgi:hypothetical protein
MIAALAGKMYGDVSGAWNWIVAAVCVLMGLHLMGVLTIPIPSLGGKLQPKTRGVDTEGAKVEPYRSQKPIMALPAIYFLDGKGAIVELLQGEVTAKQVGTVLTNR